MYKGFVNYNSTQVLVDIAFSSDIPFAELSFDLSVFMWTLVKKRNVNLF